MFPIGPQPAEGLVILLLQIRDEERGRHAVHHLVNLGDRVTSRIYEIATSDWDEGLWDEELDWFTDLLEGTNDSIIVWRFTGGTFSRFTLGAGG